MIFAVSRSGCTLVTAVALTLSVFSSEAQVQPNFFLPFESASSSSFQNFGSTGGTATSVPFATYNAPAPALNSAQAAVGKWSLYCTPSSSSPAHAGCLLLPNNSSQFRMDTSASRMTISAWVRWNGVFASNTRYGIANTYSHSQNSGWAVFIDSAGKLGYRFALAQGTGHINCERFTVNPVMTAGQWKHIAITVDCSLTGHSAIKIYVDGVAQSTTGSSFAGILHRPSPGFEVALGSYTHGIGVGGHQSLNGYLDDYQMRDGIDPPAKIRAMAKAPNLLPNHNASAMNSLFSAFDAQNSVVIGDLTWTYLPTGLNVGGRTLGDVWKGPGGEYFAWLGGTAENPVGMAATPKRVNFAHMMGGYQAGSQSFAWSVNTTSSYQDPASSHTHYAMGSGHGQITNYPLYPQNGPNLTIDQSAELEIKRAIRAGIDGFAIDAWASGDAAKNYVTALIAAADRLNVDFQVTICLDPSCHTTPPDGVMVQEFVNSVNWLINTHGNSPHLARRHGKVLIFTYQALNILKNHPLKATPENPAWWPDISNAWNQVRSMVGEPLFIHFDIETMIERALTRSQTADIAMMQWAGQNFDAVGGFAATWTPEKSAAYASAAKAGGAEWSQPIVPHYYNRQGGANVQPGTNMLRGCYTNARNTGATLLQVVTWNDYGECTNIAPGYSSNYTLSTLNRFHSQWWKTGSAPTVTQDQVHLIFRRTLDRKVSWPFGTRRVFYHNVNFLEVTTMLTAAATVNVPGYGSYQAPAGYHYQQFPLTTGSVSATVTRSGTTVASATSPEKVTDRPFREDHNMVCFSSNSAAEWALDFGATAPLLYSEYGDIDGDGLPNWFEMYYFGDGVAGAGEVGWRGDFPLMLTASSPDARAAANANPDGDAFTNLQEFTNQTDPKIADVAYPIGYVWDTSGIEARLLSFNGDQDSHRRSVWFYLFRNGVEEAIPQDGNYYLMTSSGSQSMHQYAPHFDPDGLTYNGSAIFGAEIGRRQVNGVWQTSFYPRDNSAAILCWKSPVTGLVALSFEVGEVVASGPPAYHRPLVIDIKRNAEPTTFATVSLMPGQTGTLTPLSISVQKGDSLYLFAQSGSIYGGSRGYLKNIKVQLLQNSAP